MMPIYHAGTSPQSLLSLALASVLLTGCQHASESQPQEDLSLAAPAVLIEARNIDKNALRPVVSLSDGTMVQMTRSTTGRWSGSVDVLADTEYTLSIVWVERFNDRDLELARFDSVVSVGNASTTVNIGVSDYDMSIDSDSDGISNFKERENGTDPFVNNTVSEEMPVDNETDSDNEVVDETDADADVDTAAGDSNTGDEGNDGDDNDDDDDDNDDDDDDEIVIEIDPQDFLPDVRIPRISSRQAPTLDGLGVRTNRNGRLQGEWARAVQFDTNGFPLHINNLMIDADAEGPDGIAYRRWAAMHDGEYLYVLALVDDLGQRTSDSQRPYQDDSLEVFLDGDNSKFDSWGDADDFHVIIPMQPLFAERFKEPNTDRNGRSERGQGSSRAPLQVNFTTGPGVGPDGLRIPRYEQDVYELRIKLSDAGITPGRTFGFELQINDDDDGNNRESKWGWRHPSRNGVDTDQTYRNPSFMGTAILQ